VTGPSARLLQPKYPQIHEIVFTDLEVLLPGAPKEVELTLGAIPDGFIKDPQWGAWPPEDF
jgi:hypothetical protein